MWKKVLNIVNYLFGSLFNIALAAAIVVIAYTVTIWAFNYGQELLANPEENGENRDMSGIEEFLVEIPDDASTLDIARILRSYGLIDNEWIFYLNSILNGQGNHFQAGIHQFNTGMSQQAIMSGLLELQEITSDQPRITIVEGLANWQIADFAATLEYFTAAEFLYEAENGLFSHVFLRDIDDRPNRLEGFLFPDTYYLPPNPTPNDLIIRMLNRFDDVFTPEMWLRIESLSELLGMELTIEDIVIIASIIEREAVIPDERPIVASVIYNRLRLGMPLEKISTIVYATNTRHDLLTAADFSVNSPYNTFNRNGLPIGPISNPGLSSINAALNPRNTQYLFMVINDQDARSHYFTNSHEAYLAAVARYADSQDDGNGAD